MSETLRPLVAGNWKMNGTRETTRALIAGLAERIRRDGPPPCDILVCPPAPYLAEAAAAIAASAGAGVIGLGGQDCHTEAAGAHTGDVAATMLSDLGCGYVVVGHSERRTDHGETDALVSGKAKAALAAGLTAIVCVGETLAERDAGKAVAVVTGQVAASLPEGAAAANTVLAYEPVWAIGTGRTPTTGDIAEMHGRLRETLAGRLADGGRIRILYGGSVKPDNARAILAIGNVDGALVGGASLLAEDFWAICRAAA